MALRNEDLLLFQFKSWFPLFESCSIRGLDIPLPRDAVRYLLDDRLFVADDNVAVRTGCFCRSINEYHVVNANP